MTLVITAKITRNLAIAKVMHMHDLRGRNESPDSIKSLALIDPLRTAT